MATKVKTFSAPPVELTFVDFLARCANPTLSPMLEALGFAGYPDSTYNIIDIGHKGQDAIAISSDLTLVPELEMCHVAQGSWTVMLDTPRGTTKAFTGLPREVAVWVDGYMACQRSCN